MDISTWIIIICTAGTILTGAIMVAPGFIAAYLLARNIDKTVLSERGDRNQHQDSIRNDGGMMMVPATIVSIRHQR